MSYNDHLTPFLIEKLAL